MTRFRVITPLASQWRRPNTMSTLPTVVPGKKWFGFLNIPEGRSGSFAIRHRVYEPGSMFQTATSRTQIFAGHARYMVMAPDVVTVHELSEGSSVWMTDLPIEQAQIDPHIVGMTGRVLVGGLGLGYAAQTLALNPKVTEVVVIERSKHVIDLVRDHLKGSRSKKKNKLTVIHSDLFRWLKANQDQRFTSAYYDIWAPDGERVLFERVLPLRKLTGSIVDPERVFCWNEDVMRGQLLTHLGARITILRAGDPESGKWGISLDSLCKPIIRRLWSSRCSSEFSVLFFQALRDGKFTLDDALARAKVYTDNYGIPGRKLPW